MQEFLEEVEQWGLNQEEVGQQWVAQAEVVLWRDEEVAQQWERREGVLERWVEARWVAEVEVL